MRDEMTIEDATNVVNVLSDVLAGDANEDVRELATAARQLVRHITEQSSELERERARRRSLARGDVRVPDGNPLKEGIDAGASRLPGGRPVHAGEPLLLLTCKGWHPVRYESNFPAIEPVLYLPLPGVRQDVVIAVPVMPAWPGRRTCGSSDCEMSMTGRRRRGGVRDNSTSKCE
jgi:hypothetical protein